MDAIARLVAMAAQNILEPTPRLPDIESGSWKWKWDLVGNETAQERAAIDLMLVSAKRFISDMATGADPRWLTFIGLSGAGKTWLAEQIRDFVKAHDRQIYERHDRKRIDPGGERASSLYVYAQGRAMLTKWTKLMAEMRSGEYDRYKAAGDDWFKIIDDFGLDSFDATGTATMLARGKMADLCDRRLRKWTVWTTNFTRKQLADDFDPRISSRMMRDGNIIVDATCIRDFNLRLEMANKRAA